MMVTAQDPAAEDVVQVQAVLELLVVLVVEATAMILVLQAAGLLVNGNVRQLAEAVVLLVVRIIVEIHVLVLVVLIVRETAV